MTAERSTMVAPGEGEVVLRGGVGVVRKISAAATGGAFSVVEHPLEPGALAAPPHTHANVDEYSFVIEGEIGVLIGEGTFRAAVGAYVLKPRGVPHTFWNPGPEPARVLEIISPAVFEEYFEDVVVGAQNPHRGPDEFPISGILGKSMNKSTGSPLTATRPCVAGDVSA